MLPAVGSRTAIVEALHRCFEGLKISCSPVHPESSVAIQQALEELSSEVSLSDSRFADEKHGLGRLAHHLAPKRNRGSSFFDAKRGGSL
jgi:hypothetical protein